MKINDIIIEGHKGKLDAVKKRAMHRTHAYNDGHDAGNNYNFYRVGMAAAMADGTNKKLDIDDRTWYHNNNVAVPYTEDEHKMMHQAFKSIKTDINQPVTDHRSREAHDTNKNSVIRAAKPNKFGV